MPGKEQRAKPPENVVPADTEHDGIPQEVAEVLSDLPEPKRKEVTRIMMAGFSMISRTSPEGEIAKKITPDHISSMLNAQEKGMDYTYKENQHRMIFLVVILFLVLAAIILVIYLLKDNNAEAMTQILTALISATLGAAGGYGIGSRKRDDD